jgi:hypothetical protein
MTGDQGTNVNEPSAFSERETQAAANGNCIPATLQDDMVLFFFPQQNCLFIFIFSDDDDLDADRAEWPGRARQSSLLFPNAWAKKHRQKSIINRDRIMMTVSRWRALGIFLIVAVPSSQRTCKPPASEVERGISNNFKMRLLIY